MSGAPRGDAGPRGVPPRGLEPAPGERALAQFLRALMAARRSLALYPPGSEMAGSWVHRLHRTLETQLAHGLRFPVRIEGDRFASPVDDVVAAEPALEAFRFDLEARGIRELEIDPAVRDWELQVLLELLNVPAGELAELGGAGSFLAGHGVTAIRLTAPSDGGTGDPGSDVHREALRTGRDAVEVFTDVVLDRATEGFTDLSYDRAALTAWLGEVAGGDARRLFRAVRMLHGLAERASDREVRGRTVIEALLAQPEPLLRDFFGEHLVPVVGRDVVALNLFSQLTEDELHGVVRLVPPDSLMTLSSELLEFPWEETRRRRLVDAITSAIRPEPADGVDAGPGAVAADDPVIVELREEIVAACHPDVLLERSADVLLALALSQEAAEYGDGVFDALEEVVGEALARDRLGLAVRVLGAIGSALQVTGVRAREHVRRLGVLQQRLAGRTHVALVAGLLRPPGIDEGQLALAAEYLLLVPRDAVREFTAILADERDRQVRARMCQVLARVGQPAAPVLLEWLSDSRWYVVRNAVHVLGRIGDPAAFDAIAALLEHPHARVRIEAVRALAALAPARAVARLVPVLRDADPAVRVESVRALGALRADEAVPALRALASGRLAGGGEDFAIRREAVEALAAIGSPASAAALRAAAKRRVWPWQRTERRLRSVAVAALSAVPPPEEHEDE